MTEQPRTIVDAHGRPARTAKDPSCPRCGAGEDKRVAANGFGVIRPACGQCGFWFADDVFVEKERD